MKQFKFTHKLKQGGSVKSEMKCGEVRRSNREGKKIMKLYCIGGDKKLVHAGAKGYTHEGKPSPSDTPAQKERRANFKARHNCSEAKPGTPKHLACTELWKQGGKFYFKSGGSVDKANMLLLDHVGKPQMELEGGEIVFSRVSTSQIIDLAMKANNDEGLYELGKAVFEERIAQRERDKRR